MRFRPAFVAAIGVSAAATAAWLFPRALPIIAVNRTLTRDAALTRADSFFRAHDLAPAGARRAVRFEGADSLRLYVELEGGGHDSLNALVRGRDVSPFAWTVRAFVPGNVRESHVDFSPDGRIIGFERTLAEADERPAVSVDSARRLAELQLHRWIDSGADSARWRLVSTSVETRKVSARVDRTFTFERVDRRVGSAPIRADAVVAGDLPVGVGTYVEIPESFARRYAEMRSWNQILATVASIAILVLAVIGVVVLTRYARERQVRWRPAMIVGGVIGVLSVAAGLNELPGSWYWYDTAMSPTTFFATQLLMALAFGLTTGLMTAFTLAAAEVATRHAFPAHLDWWALWRHRGTREVAQLVGGGYAVAAIAFAYVALFYLVTRTLLGWWVPSEVLDDPNQIASPMPWLSGIAISLNAGVWEEALFRALPLSLLSLVIGRRPHRKSWMVAGVVLTALVFGFAHSDYASWPPYSRGVEIFLDAAFWAFLFLRFGLLMTVVAHFVYDAVLFGLFAASGTAAPYRVSGAIILLAILTPALVVLWRRMRQGHFVEAPPDARFAAWSPGATREEVPVVRERERTIFSPRSRQLALGAAALAAIVAVATPARESLGPRFTVARDRIVQTTDSMLRAHGEQPERWRRLSLVGEDTVTGWRRFLEEHEITDRAQDLAGTYAPPAWWTVRYVNTSGSAAARVDEWRARAWPDGRPLDIRRIIADSARRDTADAAALRQIARTALARAGIDTTVLRETDVTETARPNRRDVVVTYTDTSVKLPAGAEARAWVQVAGNEPLVARRGMTLPEEFLRAHRARETTRALIAGVTMMAILGFIIIAAIYVKRNRPILADDGHLGRRHAFLLVGVLMLLMLLESLNDLPSRLAGYDTSEPWGTFLGMTALGMVSSLVFALVVFGLWNVLDAMRRRVGVPMVPDEPLTLARRDVLLAGLGLAGVAFAASNLQALVSSSRMPVTPDTALDQLVPMLNGVPGLPGNVLAGTAAVGIPLLVIAALSRRWAIRGLILALLAVALGVAAWAGGAMDDGIRPLRAIASLAAVGATAWAVLRWGTRSVAAWLVASIAYEGFGRLHLVVQAPTWQEKLSGALGLAICVLLVLWLLRRLPAGIAGTPAQLTVPLYAAPAESTGAETRR